jgi:hypothetical protein
VHGEILARDSKRKVLAGAIDLHLALIGQRIFVMRRIMEIAMSRRMLLIAALIPATIAAILVAQQPAPPANTPKITDATVQKGAGDPTAEDDTPGYVCPMHKDVRENKPGKCPICGMTLILDLTESHEYPLLLTTTPKVLKANENIELKFRIEDPIKHEQVKDFTKMHGKLYHLFVVSQDTMFFNHVHPQEQPDGSFILQQKFPHPGMYRILSDIYPTGGTPQLIASTVMVPGAGFKLEIPKLQPDVTPKDDKNLHVELVTDPPDPIAGFKTMMFFRLTPNKDIEQYLEAWGHMLIASYDLIDMIHVHPALPPTDPDEGAYKQIQFNTIFPRAGIYRVWIQMQRAGVVNTVAFNIPVKNLE